MLVIVAIIINLLPIICAIQPESKLIKQLNDFFKFDYNVYVLEASRDINQFIATTEQPMNVPQSLYIFESVDWNSVVVQQIKSKNEFLIVVPESVESNLILIKQLQEVKFLKKMKIAVFFPHTTSYDDLRTLFAWCWKQLIINIFAVSYTAESVVSNSERLIHIFTYNPFGTFEVIDVTNSKNYDDFFLRQNSNFQNYTIQLEEWHDKELFVRISDEKLWNAIFGVMNASFERISDSLSRKVPSFIVPRVFEDAIEMYMYMTTTTIIMPEALPYSEFTAYLVTITSQEVFGYSLITITGLMILLSLIRYIEQKKILVFQSVADVLNLLLYDNGYINYRQLTCVEVFIIVPLTFVGMVLVNGILSNLQSYLTRPVAQPPINTIDDLHVSGLPIYTYEQPYADMGYNVLTNLSPHLNWSNRFFTLQASNFDEHKETFNRSAAFIEELSYAKTLLKIQKRLNVNGFHIPEFYLETCLCSYNINSDYPFLERFNEIVHRIKNAGLYALWLQLDNTVIENRISKLNVEHLSAQKDIDIDRFPLPMFIVYGWFASVIVFVFEIIWKKYKFSQRVHSSQLAQFHN